MLSWIVVLILANPFGDFPLNDDWAYGLPVKHLVEKGHLRLTFWQSMPLLPQFAWGALFCTPLGFSFTALRFSTVILGAVGTCFLYRVIRDLGATGKQGFLGVLCLLSNPIYLALSHTFMSDVPFLTLVLGSVLFFLRALKDDRRAPFGPAHKQRTHSADDPSRPATLLILPVPTGTTRRRAWLVGRLGARLRNVFASRSLLIGTAFALLATLVRQVGILLPLGFAFAGLAQGRFRPRIALRALLPLVIVGSSLPLSRLWIARRYGLPALYDVRDAGLYAALTDLARLHLGPLRNVFERCANLWLQLGLCLLPITIFIALDRTKATRRAVLVSAVLGGVVAMALRLVGLPFPAEAIGNVLLGEFAVGPRTLQGVWTSSGTPSSQWLTLAAGGGAGILSLVLAGRVRRLTAMWRDGDRIPHVLFASAAAFIGFAPFAVAYGAFFDRYTLFMPPLVLVVLVEPSVTHTSHRALAAALLWAIPAMVLSATSVHDYLGWGRAVWTILGQQRELPPSAVDGGFEYNNYNELYAEFFSGRPSRNRLADRSHAPMAVGFYAPSGTRKVATVSTDAWLPAAPREVVLFERGLER